MEPLEQFLGKYAPAQMRIKAANDDELRRLGPDDGVLELDRAPAKTAVAGPPSDANARHLWVIWANGLPYILERAPNIQPPLQTGKVKHSNLTGGEPAACAGELWVDEIDAKRLYVNGDSGRYGPRSAEQLEEAVALFRTRGFAVESFGWDEDANMPAKVYRR